jgi:hypothetical protein
MARISADIYSSVSTYICNSVGNLHITESVFTISNFRTTFCASRNGYSQQFVTLVHNYITILLVSMKLSKP